MSYLCKSQNSAKPSDSKPVAENYIGQLYNTLSITSKSFAS